MDVLTTVVDVHKHRLRQAGFESLAAWLEASPRHVYVGRFNRFVPGASETEWGNPFTWMPREQSVDEFEKLMRSKLEADRAKRQRLLALRGFAIRAKK